MSTECALDAAKAGEYPPATPPQNKKKEKPTPKIDPRALDENAAAVYCGVSVSYLRRCRYQGIEDGRTPGPAFRRFGAKVRYLRDELDRWLEALPKFERGAEE